MHKVNKAKVFVAGILLIGVLVSGYLLVDHYIAKNSDDVKIINKIKSNQHKKTPVVTKDDLLTLVNFENELPEDWKVDLVKLNNGQAVDRRILNDLQEMLEKMRSSGLKPLICSSYRTNEKQEKLFHDKVKEYINQGYKTDEAMDKAAFWVARPGTSEHQLGLAIDIVATNNQRLDKSQEKTAEQQWLMENSWKYGFILRYPTDKSMITGVGYEPWHYRYVGKVHAQKIKEQGICLEEYVK